MDQDETEVDIDAPNDEQPEIVDNGDGTTTVAMADQAATPESEWFGNLATVINGDELLMLGNKYLELIDEDTKDREPRDKQYADGLSKTGIAEPAPGGASFEGASRATHPVLAEAYIDFSARAIKELFPPDGPVRTKITGKQNKEKTDRATRKAAYMNWQLTQQIPGYRSELEKLLTQLPAGGTQFFKLFWDESKNRPDAEFVPIDFYILPYNAKNFRSTQRKFEKMELSELEFENRVYSGMYRDLSLGKPSGVDLDKTKSEQQTAKIEGKTDDHTDNDDIRLCYEGVIFEIIAGDDKAPDDRPVPYRITIEHSTGNVLSLYRAWREEDENFEEIENIVDWNFIPWRGALGIGLPQLIGGLADAATGSLRCLLDGGLAATSLTLLKLKGLPGGSNNSVQPTEATEIDAAGQDDIRKIAMPMPFNGPSPVLFELLGFITQAAAGVVATAEEKIADASNNMPVGTTLALIEQGSKVFSAIHARLHDSQRRVLEVLHRLNRDHMPERVEFGSDPQDYVTREDFEGFMDVAPVSDPNIFSEAQRFAQIQAVLQMITQRAAAMPGAPTIFDEQAAYARAFEMMKIPDYEEILPEKPKATPKNPAEENIDIVMGKPVEAYEGQDHQAHIQVLLDFAQSPVLGLSPIIAPHFMPAALNHLQQHVILLYKELINTEAQQVLGAPIPEDDEDSRPVSEAQAKASATAIAALGKAIEKVPAIVQQGMQMMQQMMPKPPLDPAVQVAAQDVQNRHQLGMAKIQADTQKSAQQAQTNAQDVMTKRADTLQQAHMKAAGDLQRAILDNKTDIITALIHEMGGHVAQMHDLAAQADMAVQEKPEQQGAA